MDAWTIFGILLLIVAVSCIAWVVQHERDRTRQLNRWGLGYGLHRWPGEHNDDYEDRIRAFASRLGYRSW